MGTVHGIPKSVCWICLVLAGGVLWPGCSPSGHVGGGGDSDAAGKAATVTEGAQHSQLAPPPLPLSSDAARGEAARFLGCDPAVLSLAGSQPKGEQYSWGQVQDIVWVGDLPGPSLWRATITAVVERTMGYVHRVTWEYKAVGGESAKPLPAPDEGTVRVAAGGLIRDRGSLPVADGAVKVAVTPYPPEDEYQCSADGRLADGRQFDVRVWYHHDLRRPHGYLCLMLPPEPPALSAVRIDEKGALQIARRHAEAAKGWNVIDVRLLHFCSASTILSA